MAMKVRGSKPGQAIGQEVGGDIARIVGIWESYRSRSAAFSPFLFGPFSIAGAMYAPVIWRLVTYDVSLPPVALAWVETRLALPAMREWQAAALAEPI
jgi:glutathione S-transferase